MVVIGRWAIGKAFYQPGAQRAPGWSYSYFVIFVSVSLSVCLSVCHSLGRPGNELMAAAVTLASGCQAWQREATVTYGCFELAGLFASLRRCKRKQNDASTIDSRGTALVTQAQYRESSPRSTGMARNQQLTTNKLRSEIALVLQYSVSCN